MSVSVTRAPYREAAIDESKAHDEAELVAFVDGLARARKKVRAFVFASAAMMVAAFGVLAYFVIVTPAQRRLLHDPCHDVFRFTRDPANPRGWIRTTERVCDNTTPIYDTSP
jgi:hypothetical protein